MSTQILIVTPDEGTAEVVGHSLEELAEALKLELLIDRAKHRREAEVRLERGSYGLVITDAELPENVHVAVDDTSHAGLNVMEKARQRNGSVPVVLLCVAFDRDIAEQAGARGFEYVLRDRADWDAWLANVCRRNLLNLPAEHKQLRLEVDIYLHPAGKYHSRLNIVGLPDAPWEGPLALNERTLSKISLESREMENTTDWERHLKDIGETLFDQIFQSNPMFFREYFRHLGRIGDERNASIRFVVDRDLHPIVLEALKAADEEHWMLRTPIYRRVTGPSDRYALFQDDETRENPLNCLIIEADIDHKALIPSLGLELSRLENVKSEVAWLKAHLAELKRTNPRSIGEVAVIDGPGQHAKFGDAVHEAVTHGRWHIVHFAGHSHFEPGARTGRVFFPSPRGQPIEQRTIEELSNWLAKCDARFVFLSSCHSSEEDFVFELANAHVPAVMGFRWNIEDGLAEAYTECFYRHLFEDKSLEYAFLEARKQMHATNRDKQIWASPMLVIQTKKTL